MDLNEASGGVWYGLRHTKCDMMRPPPDGTANIKAGSRGSCGCPQNGMPSRNVFIVRVWGGRGCYSDVKLLTSA